MLLTQVCNGDMASFKSRYIGMHAFHYKGNVLKLLLKIPFVHLASFKVYDKLYNYNIRAYVKAAKN